MPEKQHNYTAYFLTWAIVLAGILSVPTIPVSTFGQFAVVAVIALILTPLFYTLYMVVGSALLAFIKATGSAIAEFTGVKYWYIYTLGFILFVWLLTFPFADKSDPYEFERDLQSIETSE